MRGTFAGLLAILALMILPMQLSAQRETVQITIKGEDLAVPIELTDPAVIAGFRVWTGPGTSTNEPQGLIVDWSRGVAEPRQGLQVYEVSFLTTCRNRRYVVSYLIDPSTDKGYVYLPGKTDPGHWVNVGLIYRGIEGNWFHAWNAWEKLAHRLIGKASKTH